MQTPILLGMGVRIFKASEVSILNFEVLLKSKDFALQFNLRIVKL